MHDKIFLKKTDDKILSYVRSRFLQNLSERKDIKLQSIATIIAVGLSINSISPFFYNGFATYGQLFAAFRLVFALLCFGLYVNAFYYWRVFFELRKNRTITDKNFFFAESADLGRKILFYIAFALDSLHTFRSRLIPKDLGEAMRRTRFATREDFYCDAGLTLFQNLIFSVILVECLRLMYSKSFTWSNKKHFAFVILIAAAFTAIQLVVRYSLSGHGMFW